MSGIVELWNSAGPEVQAALIGNGILALAGAFSLIVTAYITVVQFRGQRALELKKEVLIDAAGAAHAIHSSLGALSNFSSHTDEVAKKYQESAALLVRASAVANVDTVESGLALLNAVGPEMMDLIGQRAGIQSLEDQISIVQTLIDHQLEENKSIRAQLDSAYFDGNSDRQKRLQSAFESGHKQFSKLIEERQQLLEEVEKLKWAYIPHCIKAQHRHIATINVLLAHIRADIGLDNDSGKSFLKTAAPNPKQLEQMLSKIEEFRLKSIANARSHPEPAAESDNPMQG